MYVIDTTKAKMSSFLTTNRRKWYVFRNLYEPNVQLSSPGSFNYFQGVCHERQVIAAHVNFAVQ